MPKIVWVEKSTQRLDIPKPKSGKEGIILYRGSIRKRFHNLSRLTRPTDSFKARYG